MRVFSISVLCVALVACAAPTLPTNTATRDSASSSATALPLTPDNRLPKTQSVFFDYDSYTIAPSYLPMLRLQANYLLKHPKLRLQIEGHTDRRGSVEYNLALGQRRSVAVSQQLQRYGVSPERLEAVSFGEARPKSTGSQEADHAQNRRSDLQYLAP